VPLGTPFSPLSSLHLQQLVLVVSGMAAATAGVATAAGMASTAATAGMSTSSSAEVTAATATRCVPTTAAAGRGMLSTVARP